MNYLTLETLKACLDEALADDPEPLRRRLVVEGVVEDRTDLLGRLLDCNGGELVIIVRAIPREIYGIGDDLRPEYDLSTLKKVARNADDIRPLTSSETVEEARKPEPPSADLWPPQ